MKIFFKVDRKDINYTGIYYNTGISGSLGFEMGYFRSPELRAFSIFPLEKSQRQNRKKKSWISWIFYFFFDFRDFFEIFQMFLILGIFLRRFNFLRLFDFSFFGNPGDFSGSVSRFLAKSYVI